MMETALVDAPDLMIPEHPDAVVISGFANPKIWNDNDKALALPLLKIAQRAYTLIMPRVFITGQSDTGAKFGPFSTKGPIWINADTTGKPLPPAWSDTWRNKPTGWKVYKSSASYKAALGIRSKRFVESGRAVASYAVRAITPRRVKLAPSGGRGKGKLTNAKIMREQARHAKFAPLSLTRPEATELAKMAATLLTPQLISSAYYASLSRSWRGKLAARENALRRLQNTEARVKRRLAKERRNR